ncbi:MAG: hypothetical protein IKH59_02400 [Bacteroidaceae bacterium]|nr:hypothetical protein [Bacteroidaceae bacterium]
MRYQLRYFPNAATKVVQAERKNKKKDDFLQGKGRFQEKKTLFRRIDAKKYRKMFGQPKKSPTFAPAL